MKFNFLFSITAWLKKVLIFFRYCYRKYFFSKRNNSSEFTIHNIKPGRYEFKIKGHWASFGYDKYGHDIDTRPAKAFFRS